MSRLSDRLRHPPELTNRPDAEAPSVGIQPRPISLEEAEAAHTSARQEWLDALRASRSGSHQALARLAIAQQAYEASEVAVELARAERELAMQRLDVLRQRQADVSRRAEAIAGQADAWNRVHKQPPAPRRGIVGRLFGRR